MVEIRYATGDEPEQTDTLASRVGAFRRPLIVAAAMALVAIPAGLQVWKVALGYGLFAAALLAWPSGKASARARAKADSRSALARPKDFQLLDALDLPAIVFDEETFVVRQNAASSKLIGAYPERAALSAWIRSPAILELVARVIARGEPESVEHVERVPSERWHEVRAAPIAARPITGRRLFVLTFRDLTEARRMDRMRTDFVANASHELKTPLASLMGFIETMQGPARDDEAARTEFLGIMLDQAQRMARLIDDLLSLSRLEMRAHVAPKGQVDLNAAIGHVIDTLKPMAGELGVEINLTAPDDPVLVTGDVDELIQVFSNLIENACKYGQSGKRVEITISDAEPDTAQVTVRDFGPGIAKEHVPRLTERFYRVDVETSRAKKGTGLGLAIVKHILTRHRARLVVRSKLGEGSAFTVRFSRATSDVMSPSAELYE
jgi:two-component system phosphate regulon sensor histidine kinase PhoR